MSLDHLVPEQFATALHVVGMHCIPTHPVSLALTAGGLPAGTQDGLDVVEQRLVDGLDDDL